MKKILIVEDDVNLGQSLLKICEGEGLLGVLVQNLKEAREKKNDSFDLVLLDWMLPDGQGVDFLKELRSDNRILPVILLTARAELIDKVLGLETGANDYVTKPFESRELVARMRVQLRMLEALPQKRKFVSVGELRFDFENKEILFQDKRILFTKMEFELLKLLVENPKQTFSRENLLDKVWGYDHFPTTRTVDTHVLQIRQKTSDSVIETIRGIGYRLGECQANLTKN